MERVKALINKLQEQLDQHTDPSTMALTVQMLQAELQQLQQSGPKKTGSGKVSVTMPANHKSAHTSHGNGNAYASTGKGYENPAEQESEAEIAVAKKIEEKNVNTQPAAAAAQKNYNFNPILEIPTLAHQDAVRELNDVIGHYGSSLNDQLKSNNTELAEVLTEAPIKDLKKGIGINDRYVFINELFRGDETMYERSIKTINNFHILQEAEFWMERELKLKLGWNEGKERVQHFYQLVKRRFA